MFPTGGGSGKGMAIDSKGNAWITNTVGSGLTLETKARLIYLKLTGATLSAIDRVALEDLVSHPGLGSVSMLRPDGSPAPGSPFNPGSIWGAWAVSIDGNDHAWISNFAPGGGLTELCGARTETCPAGMKTGDPISPPGGYKGGGMQLLVDASIDPAGDVWVPTTGRMSGPATASPMRAFLPGAAARDCRVLRHGKARARAADRTGAGAVSRPTARAKRTGIHPTQPPERVEGKSPLQGRSACSSGRMAWAQPSQTDRGTKFLDADAEELMRCYTSVPSASASASSTSTPRYRTVLSIFVWPSRICTARRLPVCL